MMENAMWNLFENTGNIEAYLTYKQCRNCMNYEQKDEKDLNELY